MNLSEQNSSPIYMQHGQVPVPLSVPVPPNLHPESFHGMIPVPTHVMMPYYPNVPPHMEHIEPNPNSTSTYNIPIPIGPEQNPYWSHNPNPNPYNPPQSPYNAQSQPYPPQYYDYNPPNTPNDSYNPNPNPNSNIHPYIEEESMANAYGPGPSISTSYDRIRGPEGCNLFCFHLPNEMTNWSVSYQVTPLIYPHIHIYAHI